MIWYKTTKVNNPSFVVHHYTSDGQLPKLVENKEKQTFSDKLWENYESLH